MDILLRLPNEIKERVFDFLPHDTICIVAEEASHDFRKHILLSYLPHRSIKQDMMSFRYEEDPDPWVFKRGIKEEVLENFLGPALPVIRALMVEGGYISGGFARNPMKASDIDVFIDISPFRINIWCVVAAMRRRLKETNVSISGARIWAERRGSIAMIYIPGCSLPVQIICTSICPKSFDLSHCKCKIFMKEGRYMFAGTLLYMLAESSKISIFNRWSEYRPNRIEKAERLGFRVIATTKNRKFFPYKDQLWDAFWKAIFAELQSGVINKRCRALDVQEYLSRSSEELQQEYLQGVNDYSKFSEYEPLNLSIISRTYKPDVNGIVFILEDEKRLYVSEKVAIICGPAERFIASKTVSSDDYKGWKIIHTTMPSRDFSPVLLFQ